MEIKNNKSAEVFKSKSKTVLPKKSCAILGHKPSKHQTTKSVSYVMEKPQPILKPQNPTHQRNNKSQMMLNISKVKKYEPISLTSRSHQSLKLDLDDPLIQKSFCNDEAITERNSYIKLIRRNDFDRVTSSFDATCITKTVKLCLTSRGNRDKSLAEDKENSPGLTNRMIVKRDKLRPSSNFGSIYKNSFSASFCKLEKQLSDFYKKNYVKDLQLDRYI